MKKFRFLVHDPRLIAIGGLLVGLGTYVVGLPQLFIFALLASLAIFMPMPRVFSSWLGRTVVAFLLLFALVQLAATVQFFIYPGGQFKFIAAVVFLLASVLILLFGATKQLPGKRLLSSKDLWVIIASILFVLPFHAILLGHGSLLRIAEIADSQISDSVNHYVQIDHMSRAQTFDYAKSYYPSGFHITTAFIEDSVVKEIDQLSWSAQAMLFFSQYIFLGLLLLYVFIFFLFDLLERFGVKQYWLVYLSAALAGGLSLTVLNLWLFIEEGFLNYFYICATLLLASAWLFEGKQLYQTGREWRTYIWPLSAFLLLGAGVSLSWPLFTPVLLVTLLSIVLPTFGYLRREPARYLLIHLPVIVLGVFNLLAIYLQLKYSSMSSAQALNLGGALHYFNIPLLLIELSVLAYVLYCGKYKTVSTRIAAIFFPYTLLTIGLMAYQFFTLGEASYYLIKSAMVLEMLLLALMIAVLCRWAQDAHLSSLITSSSVVVFILFVTTGTLGMASQPFNEVRTLFRNASGIGTPAYIRNDSAAVAALGKHNELNNYNMTILHYDPSGNQFYAQIEVALWGHIMAPFTQKNYSIADQRGGNCSGMQYNILAYGMGNAFLAEPKSHLVQAVDRCIVAAQEQGIPYYIITDRQSTPKLEQLFPESNVRLIN